MAIFSLNLHMVLSVCTWVLGWSVVSDSLQPHGLSPSRLLCPWDFPGKSTGVGCHFLLQGIFLIQGLKPCLLYLLHCRRILHSLSRHFACIQISSSHQYTSHCIRPHFNDLVHATPWTVSHQAPLSMEILQSRILEWVAMPFSRGSSPLRDQTQVSCIWSITEDSLPLSHWVKLHFTLITSLKTQFPNESYSEVLDIRTSMMDFGRTQLSLFQPWSFRSLDFCFLCILSSSFLICILEWRSKEEGIQSQCHRQTGSTTVVAMAWRPCQLLPLRTGPNKQGLHIPTSVPVSRAAAQVSWNKGLEFHSNKRWVRWVSLWWTPRKMNFFFSRG